MNKFGFVRVAAVSPEVSIGNPQENAQRITDILAKLGDHDVVVFPELCMTGYSCGDLFGQSLLLEDTENSIRYLLQQKTNQNIIYFVGAPVVVRNELYNCAIVIADNKLVGIIPKSDIPTYREFYERRKFRGATGNEPKEIDYCGQKVPFGIDLLFKFEKLIVQEAKKFSFIIGADICESVWVPIPPSSYHCLAGANLLVNLSASNETVGKNDYRRLLILNQSGRCVAAYVYASSGPSESTDDVVFGAHCLIAENGKLLAESDYIGRPDIPMNLGCQVISADVDIEQLQSDRLSMTSFGDASGLSTKEYRFICTSIINPQRNDKLIRKIDGMPFVPKDPITLKNRCAEVFGIQCAGLAKRLKKIREFTKSRTPNIYIGVSGGLDSTLALLVAVKTYKALGFDLKGIHGVTMPGFGTTEKTNANANKLMELLNISQETIDIRAACLQVFKDTKYDPFNMGLFDPSVELDKFDVECFEEALKHLSPEDLKKGDLGFENTQAKVRTLMLMSKGFVLGTGDLSEIALGWCTYNGDHMSMYNVNCGVPKTLVKFLVKYVAEYEVSCFDNSKNDFFGFDLQLHSCLMDIANTIISPELLPAGADGQIVQSSEDILGPYELHDFYLSYFFKFGFSPEKLLYLSSHAEFSKDYSFDLRKKTLRTFIQRFFSQHFKRMCVPGGPKIGSVSLSPRGDCRMPSETNVEIWLRGLE